MTHILSYLLLAAIVWWPMAPAAAADEVSRDAKNQSPALTRAVMCEYIQGIEPQSVAVVFSIKAGKISCFTAFNAIKKTTHAFHKWYRRDALVTTKRLTLKPPRWSTYSSIQLREADRGPWRVEIWSAGNQLLNTLRFSVID